MTLDLSLWEWVWVGAIMVGVWLIVPVSSDRGARKEDPPGDEDPGDGQG